MCWDQKVMGSADWVKYRRRIAKSRVFKGISKEHTGELSELAEAARGQGQSLVYAVFGEAELLAQVLGNDAKSPITRFFDFDKSHHYLMLINAHNHS